VVTKKRLVLTRALKGRSVTLANVQFVNGVAEVEMPLTEFEGLFRYLSRSYQVEIDDGQRQVHPEKEKGKVQDVHGDVHKAGRPPEKEADDGKADAEAEEGNAGVRADGDGQKGPTVMRTNWSPKQGKDYVSATKKKKR